jgi:type III restriction enzyme
LFEICWPNVVRIDHVYRPQLSLNWGEIRTLTLNATETARIAELAPILAGKPDTSKVEQIDLERLAQEFRTQKIVFEAARDVFDQMRMNWKGSKEALLAQVVRLVEQFIRSDKIKIVPALFETDQLRRRLVITLNMTKVVQHLWEAIRFENTEKLELVFDQERPIRSTGDMATWYTGKPCGRAAHSHINFCVYDSTWEASEAFELDNNSMVDAWVKNDHLRFEILYIYQGVVRKYRPDFIIRLKGGEHLVLEVKGQDTEQEKTKRAFLAEWVTAVNEHGGFGTWSWDVSKTPADVKDIIARHASKEKAASDAGGS